MRCLVRSGRVLLGWLWPSPVPVAVPPLAPPFVPAGTPLLVLPLAILALVAGPLLLRQVFVVVLHRRPIVAQQSRQEREEDGLEVDHGCQCLGARASWSVVHRLLELSCCRPRAAQAT